MGERCSKMVMRDYHRYQCQRPGSHVGPDGKHYCGQHNPAAVEQRQAERRKQWEAEYEQREATRREADAMRELAEAVMRRPGKLPAWLEALAAAVREARKVPHA